jgi:biotin carboxylase
MQIPAIKAARSKGYRTIVADADPSAPGVRLADVFEKIDLKDKDGMLEAARRHRVAAGLDGVFTAGTDFSATVAYVAEQLGLPGVSYEVALNASDKARMRACFRLAGVPHPRFAVVDAASRPAADVPCDHLNDLALPVVVKPVDNMGARGVVKIVDRASLSEAIADASRFARSGNVIVEEFIEGPEFSIDSVVVNGRVIPTGVADRHIRFEPYFVEVGHTIPTKISEAEESDLLAVFADGVRALGIENGVAKGDVFLGPDGPVIGEIAARLSGGYMSGWTFPLSSGVDLTGAALDQALGIGPGSLEPSQTHTAAERALISCDGIVAEMVGVDRARNVEGVRELFLRASSGATVRFPRNNVEKCGNVIAVAEGRETAVAAAERAIASMVVRLEPHTAETHRFLFSKRPPTHRCFPELEDRVTGGHCETLPADAAFGPSVCLRVARPLPHHRDWSFRTAEESLGRLENLVDLRIVDEPTALDSWFFRAFARAGLQGALYVLDSVSSSPRRFAERLSECRG